MNPWLRLWWLPGLVLPAMALALAAHLGAVPVLGSDWLAPWQGSAFDELPGSAWVLWHLRLPRMLFALLIGALLGLCGALAQALFRNPLADPGLLGVSNGAACAAALSIVVAGSMNAAWLQAWRIWLLPGAAFAGAFSICLLLDRVARWLTPGSVSGLLLTGVALNALTAALIGMCTYLANDEQLRSLSFWTLGSLAGGGWLQLASLLPLLLLASWRVARLCQPLNALALGVDAARQVGIDVARLRGEVILLVALLCGVAAAWCGMIGFIGLMAPHLVRLCVGADQRRVLPGSAWLGGLLLLLADTLARSVAQPAEMPVGIFTALIGAPFFLLLLSRSQGRLG